MHVKQSTYSTPGSEQRKCIHRVTTAGKSFLRRIVIRQRKGTLGKLQDIFILVFPILHLTFDVFQRIILQAIHTL